MARSLLANETIAGRYQLVARIGSGGMGQVFRARDTVLGRTVAVKLLPDDVASRPGIVERFRAEAQSAARISHPNVVQIHDWGEHGSTYYMVMEYVRGRNLREILATQRVAPRQAAEIMAAATAGLSAAHAQGLVHRDIKPENVIVGIDGTVKVTDFGIARAAEGTASTGDAFGTVAYVAPEQARGLPLDGRADLYSAGCVLYELLTGSPPYEGDAASVLYHHLNDRVGPPSLESSGVSHDLDRIVGKATDPEVATRYSSATEMRTDLLQVIPSLAPAADIAELTYELTSEVPVESMDTMAVAPKRRKRHGGRWVLALLVLAGLGLAGWMFRPARVPGVIGLEQPVASRRITALGFQVSIKHSFSEETAGTVIAVDPPVGKLLRRGASVALKVSDGPPLVDVPLLAGMTLDQAKQAIAQAGLSLGSVTEQHAKAASGQVLSQTPAPGKARRGDPVNLIVSSGPQVVTVPQVVGKTFDEARSILEGSGFAVQRVDAFNDAAAGTVFAQDPPEGARVEQGSGVKVSVSKGPQPFAMPDVRGKACAAARDQLTQLGMTVVVRSAKNLPCGPNVVTEQDPFPGATAHKGEEATLYTG